MELAYIPSPGFSTITIGSVTIRMYAIMILLGIVAAVWISARRWKKVGGDFDQILDISIVAVPCGIIGARLYHVITTPERFFGSTGNPADIFRIWQGGLGIWGGILLGALGAWAWCRHRHYPMALLADAVAPALLVAQAIGRLGNWFNQELYGAPTTLPWGLKLNPNASGAIGSYESCYQGSTCPTDTLFHPTFLYEMIWNLIGAYLLVWLGRKFVDKFKAGTLFCFYVMWYTLGRTWIEYLRIDYAHTFLGVRINVWVSIIVFVLSIVAFFFVQRYGQSTAVLSDKLFAITQQEEKQRNDEEQAEAQRLREKQRRKKEEEERKANGETERNEDESGSGDDKSPQAENTESAEPSDADSPAEAADSAVSEEEKGSRESVFDAALKRNDTTAPSSLWNSATDAENGDASASDTPNDSVDVFAALAGKDDARPLSDASAVFDRLAASGDAEADSDGTDPAGAADDTDPDQFQNQ